jgi:hypothetical protein
MLLYNRVTIDYKKDFECFHRKEMTNEETDMCILIPALYNVYLY